jgi:dGTPase
MKYPWGSKHQNAASKGKFGFFETERRYAEAVAEQMDMMPDGDGWHRHPLAYLVEVADDICYRLADAEDGIEVGDYSFAEYESLLMKFIANTQRPGGPQLDLSVYGERSLPHKILYLRSRAMIILGEHACEMFHHHQDALWDATFRTKGDTHGEILHATAGADDGRTKVIHRFLRALKQVAEKRLYNGARKLHIETAYHKVIHTLLTELIEARLKPKDSVRHGYLLRITGLGVANSAPAKGRDRAEAVQEVVDIVAGMTDHYALQLFRQIEGISHSTTSPMPLC